MIITLLTLSFAATQPAAPHARAEQFAGLLGKRRWIEKVQQVQTDYDYSPTVGRRAEPAAAPLVPTRYLSAEERSQPIIVAPAPVIIPARAEPETNTADTGQVPPAPMPDFYAQPTGSPSYLTSTPEQMGAADLQPAGSATGSRATADYGMPR